MPSWTLLSPDGAKPTTTLGLGCGLLPWGLLPWVASDIASARRAPGPGAGLIDETSGQPGFADWGFEVIKFAGFLLSHGAHFLYTADDAFNPSIDPEHPGLVFPLPGPGMYASAS